MLAAASDARIVYVGETHDNPASHRQELAVLQALDRRYPGGAALGMEMFTPAQQEVLDRWSAGELTEKEFLKTVRVYGGTSGGVVAAVQAARMGKRTILVEPGRHLGGMTAAGLGAVDIGDPRSVGGVARVLHPTGPAPMARRWPGTSQFEGHGPATGGAFAIGPHPAERLFNAIARVRCGGTSRRPPGKRDEAGAADR